MEKIKNYVILLIVSGLFIWLAWGLITQYAKIKESEELNLMGAEIAEIKPMDLKDFLLETPDVIVLLIVADESAELNQLKDFLASNNLLQQSVYLNLNISATDKITAVEENLDVSYQTVKEQNTILIIDDFATVAKMPATDDKLELEKFFAKWGYLDD